MACPEMSIIHAVWCIINGLRQITKNENSRFIGQ